MEDIKRFEDVLIMLLIKKNVPEDLQDLVWDAYRIYFSDRKGFRGFSSSEQKFWEKLVDLAWKRIRDEKIAELERMIRRLEEENTMLKEKLKKVYAILQDLKESWKNDPERFALLLTALLET